MEEILKGRLKINKVDVYTEYGAFLVEENQGDFSNYEELLKPPAMKPYHTVSFREENGEKLPSVLPSPRFEARDVTLYFAIVVSSESKSVQELKAEWLEKYKNFVTMLKTGDGGWLNIEVPELGKTYKMYYKQCSQYSQITHLENGKTVAAKLKVVLREPQPTV